MDMVKLRLKKGIRVEVSSKSGCWWPAEIISGNGHTYVVKYDGHQPGMAVITERVPRKVIRPLPPSMDDGMMHWSPGDIVEALEMHSWKLARILSKAAGDNYVVAILGSSEHIMAHKSKLRVPQAWKDDHWIIIQHDAENEKVVKRSVEEEGKQVNSPVPQPSQEMKRQEVEGQDHSCFEEGPRKRRRIYLSPIKLHIESNDTQKISSSHYRSYCNPATSPTQDILADAEVYYRVLSKLYFAMKDEKRENFHHLELHAYHRILMKMYSSATLTWKQEVLLTNIRLQLHISNDEHQSELKHLASTQRNSDRVVPKLS